MDGFVRVKFFLTCYVNSSSYIWISGSHATYPTLILTVGMHTELPNVYKYVTKKYMHTYLHAFIHVRCDLSDTGMTAKYTDEEERDFRQTIPDLIILPPSIE